MSTAPDGGYAPTSVDLLVQSVDDTETNGDAVHLTMPYGGIYTDAFVADVVAAATAAALAPFPGGRITQTTLTYAGQATVTLPADPPPDPDPGA